jgi:hypothetical protein
MLNRHKLPVFLYLILYLGISWEFRGNFVGISTTDYQLFINFFGNLMGNSWEIAKSRIRNFKNYKTNGKINIITLYYT